MTTKLSLSKEALEKISGAVNTAFTATTEVAQNIMNRFQTAEQQFDANNKNVQLLRGKVDSVKKELSNKFHNVGNIRTNEGAAQAMGPLPLAPTSLPQGTSEPGTPGPSSGRSSKK